MNSAFGLILIAILLCGIALSYLGPSEPRSDWRFLDYHEPGLDMKQDWQRFTIQEHSPDRSEISQRKQQERANLERQQDIKNILAEESGQRIGYRDMSSYNHFMNLNQAG